MDFDRLLFISQPGRDTPSLVPDRHWLYLTPFYRRRFHYMGQGKPMRA